ncbi:hypothetical protein, partial [uncultured Bifidobacterium sp.]|uniref:hypothetical protein n=1 Tax=uncultured Bifidobacterium sp. TaxID=165187 RepID=UPI0025D7FFB5
TTAATTGASHFGRGFPAGPGSPAESVAGGATLNSPILARGFVSWSSSVFFVFPSSGESLLIILDRC